MPFSANKYASTGTKKQLNKQSNKHMKQQYVSNSTQTALARLILAHVGCVVLHGVAMFHPL